MKRLALLFAVLASAPAMAQKTSPFEVGQVFAAPNNTTVSFDGWIHAGGTFLEEPVGEVCCLSLFVKDHTYIIAATKAVAKTSTGGVTAEQIVALSQPIKIPVGQDILADCGLPFSEGLSYPTGNGDNVVTWFFKHGEFDSIEWVDKGHQRCDYGD